MNILFICTANKDRSRTAEHLFQKENPQFEFDSAGIDECLCQKYNGKYVDYDICEKADRIICMEFHHAQYLIKKFGSHLLCKIEVLEIEDNEEYMSLNLIQEIKGKFKLI